MKKTFLTLLIASTLIGCNKEKANENTNCDDISSAILNNDESYLSSEIDSLSSDLTSSPTLNDSVGHQSNVNTLISRLNAECSVVSYSLECYTCIKTLPLISEIHVSIDSSGTNTTRTIDVSTPSNGLLEFRGIH